MNYKAVKRWLQNLPIKMRLLYGYFCSFLLILIVSCTIIYFYIHSSIYHKFESELSNSAHFIQNLIQSSAKTSLINTLNTSAKNNLDIIISIYHQDLPEAKAKEMAAKILNSQKIGKTGYLYCVDSLGVIQVHPNNSSIGKKQPESNKDNRRIGRKNGYSEYDWVDPHKKITRRKIQYTSYFGPWDWMITATSFLDEFKETIEMDNLEASILSRHFGQSGYAYIMDSKGNLIIHPKLQGTNIYDSIGPKGRKFIEEICRTKEGSTTYHWQNPGEHKLREKLVYYRYIKELDWIVVTTGYFDEALQPLKTLKFLIITAIIIAITVILAITFQISATITKPIKYLMAGLKGVSNGDLSVRLSPKSSDELGRLESYFNTFIAQLEESNTRLHESEKDFRSIFENSVEGIFQFDMHGNILRVNPSFVFMLGYDSGQAMLEKGANLYRDFLVKKELWDDLIDTIISERAVKGLEIQVYRKSGAVFWCMLNARGIYETGSDKMIKIEGFLSDINEMKVAQENQDKLMGDLEVMVGERTSELSTRIAELEERDRLNRYMGEMGDMLQSCRTTEETFPVINQYLKLFFPNDNCALYLYDATKQMIDRVVPPPSDTAPFISMTNESCWALRQGKNYLYEHDMDQGLTCEHVGDAPNGYICIPLIAQGVTIGLLHILFHGSEERKQSKTAVPIDSKTRLWSRLAEHLSLALANLKLQEKLKLKSIQDSLTGLANRRHMEEILQRQFFRMHRYNTPCSLVMLDVDHFKTFNDTYGHDMGDVVLKELGTFLKDNCRGEDLACRYGGEEFIIILVNTRIEQAAKKAEKLRNDISETLSIPYLSEELHVTVSIGVATSPNHGRNMTELLKSADNALYLAKKNGRNRVEVVQTPESEE